MPQQVVRWSTAGRIDRVTARGERMLLSKSACIVAIAGASVTYSAFAMTRKDVTGESQWSSPALQGAAGIGAFSESWVDQAHSDPSLLARRKGTFELEYAGLTGMVSRDAVSTISDTIQSLTSEANSGGTSSAAKATVDALNKVRSVFGKSMTVQAHASLLSARFARVGLAPYMSGIIDAGIDNAAWPKFDSYGGGYAGTLISYSQTAGKDFDLGVSLRPGAGGFRRYEVDLSLLGDFLGNNSTTSGSESPLSKMLEFPVAFYCPLDLGFAWWADKSTRVSIVSKNTFDAVPVKIFSGTPSALQSRLNLGFVREIDIPAGKTQSLNVATEIQDIAGIRGGWNEFLLRWQWAGQYTVRLPFREQTTFGLNVGMHSGYPVASIHLDFIIAKFEAALSARENGAYPGQRANRLISARILSQIQF